MKIQLIPNVKLYEFKPLEYYMDPNYSFTIQFIMDHENIKITFMDVYYIRVRKEFQKVKSLYELPSTSNELIVFSQNYTGGGQFDNIIRYYQFENGEDIPIIDVVAEAFITEQYYLENKREQK